MVNNKEIALIRYVKLAVILVAVFEGEGDNITARVDNVEKHTVGRWSRPELCFATAN